MCDDTKIVLSSGECRAALASERDESWKKTLRVMGSRGVPLIFA